jgi:hypothetical protein
MVNREACELGHPPVPSSPRLQYCGFTVYGSAQTRYEDAWSFVFVLKVLTWHLATPWGPGEPVGGSVKVLTAGRCLLLVRCWYTEPGGPCVMGEESWGKLGLSDTCYPCMDDSDNHMFH